jgi:hypothetical protein
MVQAYAQVFAHTYSEHFHKHWHLQLEAGRCAETLLKVLEGRDSFVHVHIKNMEARVQSAEDRLAEMQANTAYVVR